MQPNEIFVSSKKPAINYVLAVQTQVAQGQNPIFIRGRGNNINKAVDVALIALREEFIKDFKIFNIKIGTDVFKLKDGKDRNVSTIEICLKKP